MLGIEGLSRRSYTAGRSRKTARLAALCALLPGMGAVYNRQNLKAIAHFAAVVGLFQFTSIPFLDGFFALAGVCFYFYSILDAYRTARYIADGGSAAADEEQFKRTLARRAPVIGLISIVAGLLLFIQVMRPFFFQVQTARLLPVGLVILGGYLLTRYFKRAGGDNTRRESQGLSPYSLIKGGFGDQGAGEIRSLSHKDAR